MLTCFWAHSAPRYRTCWSLTLQSPLRRQKLGLVEAKNFVPLYGHLGQREPVVQPAMLGIIAILGGRFLFWEVESEKRREVRTDEKAHFFVDRGADVGADDVVRGRSVRQAGPDGPARERLYHHAPGELDQLPGGV